LTTTVHDIIEDFRALPVSARERGERFERLMAQYLRLDPIYGERYSDVWLWSDWPGRDGKGDTGIDLVAKERDGDGYCAIQCKFYAPDHHLQKADIDSFFTASGKHPFTSRIVISTTDKWGANAEAALEQQQIPVSRVGLAEIAQAPINWDLAWPSHRVELQLRRHDPKTLRPHQRAAVDDVLGGFAQHDRGKLIMACGTGKTFTSLRIAERIAERNGGSARVLFLVPSIALLSQTLREWTANCEVDLRSFPVCSDTKVGRSTSEDISAHDLAVPATTDTEKLVGSVTAAQPGTGLTVIFSTYQSIDVVARAQHGGLGEFDLVICDEAHRTTGVTLADADESSFVRVHDNAVIAAGKRLYMTATPRLFGDAARSRAQEAGAEIASMDDETKFGPEFHHLGFGTAVGKGLLTDYKVLILTVDERYIARSLQSQVADADNEINLDDAVKIVGCWNGLAKRAGRGADGSGFPAGDVVPMARAVAFSHSIKASEKLRNRFTEVIGAYDDADEDVLRCEVDHVDGTQNALVRNQKLDWLRADTEPGVCRILSNARCLSEGVDVPDLDAVLFLSPRNSIVDVVQSVGRVMRRAEGKDYGYIILPVGIPAGMEPSQALADNKRYKVVWDVLQALRAHDDRFNATINKLDLNRDRPDNIMVGNVGGDADAEGEQAAADQLPLFTVEDWRDAIYARIVTKVGERTYWEVWASDVARIAGRHTDRIGVLLEGADDRVRTAFDEFLLGLRNNLNDGIDRGAAIDMLAQHLVTKPVFDALFADYDFAAHNPVSQVMQRMLDVLDDQALDKENESLVGFYASVRMRAEGIDNAEGKQQIIAELYERFFRLAFAKTAASLGIVYTPTEIVDFILRAVDDVLRAELDATLSDAGVHVLDPFTGTGTFVTRLLQSGLVRDADLPRKYASELHANEILLLAYYIAAINIEATYHGLLGGDYVPFNGIVLTDTFQIHEEGDAMDELMFPRNNARVAHQKTLDIRVVVGNPPYSKGQSSANDNNANIKYPTLDAAIERTYAARSSATNKNWLYDSYIRAIRWASDRIGNEGVLAYVCNGGFIDSNVADGLRKTLAGEFSSIYVFNLRGNQRTAGELSRREGGKVFGGSSRSTVAILLLVKNPRVTGPCRIRYRDIGDYLTREQKLSIVRDSRLSTLDWEVIQPNAAGDWVNQRNDQFLALPPIGDKPAKGAAHQTTVFASYGAGLQTNRDAWVYNFSALGVDASVLKLLGFYNEIVDEFQQYCAMNDVARSKDYVDEFLDPRGGRSDPRRISWSRSLKGHLAKLEKVSFEPQHQTTGLYRPFCRQQVYFDRHLNHERARMPSMFPTSAHSNVGFYLTGVGSDRPFSLLMTNEMPDLAFWGSSSGQFFPRYTYRPVDEQPTLGSAEAESGFTQADNITNAILADYRAAYGPDLTKDAIFHYVYGLLHSPDYRARFAADLKKMLPRIPKVRDFHAFAKAGRALAELHVGYESAAPHALEEIVTGKLSTAERYRVQQMRFAGSGKQKDRTKIVYNAHLTLAGIPEEAYRYQLGSRSAVEWVMDRYRVTTDKASGIVNDPNDWAAEQGEPRYIVELVKRVVTVSWETMRIVDALPTLDILDRSR